MDPLWITWVILWITFPNCGNVDNSGIFPHSYPQVIHTPGAIRGIRFIELSTFPHTPTTTTTNYI